MNERHCAFHFAISVFVVLFLTVQPDRYTRLVLCSHLTHPSHTFVYEYMSMYYPAVRKLFVCRHGCGLRLQRGTAELQNCNILSCRDGIMVRRLNHNTVLHTLQPWIHHGSAGTCWSGISDPWLTSRVLVPVGCDVMLVST